MIFVFILLLATTMAVFGIYGHPRGTLIMLVNLAILGLAVFLVESRADQLLLYLNGMYIGLMLVLKSGLNDLASGNLESAAAKLESIEKPFVGTTANLGLLLIILAAVLIGWLVGLMLKKKRKAGIVGTILGLFYGYLLSAAILPLLGFPAGFLPLPFLRPFDPKMPAPAAAAATGTGGGSLLARLSQPETINLITIAITASMAVFLLASARRSAKSGKRG